MNKIKLICIILKLAQSTNLFRNAHLTSKNECYNYCLKNKETFPELNCFKFLRMGKIFEFLELFLMTVSPSTLGDGFNCVDKNECLEAPCDVNAVCENTPGRYQCTCKDGYSGKYKFS